MAPFSGTDDGLVYLHVAQRIIQGDGITLPYIWNFLASPESSTPPAFGYWMPAATFITVPSLKLLGSDSVLGALLPQFLLLVVFIVTSYAIAFQFTKNRMLASTSALIVAFHPWTIGKVTTSEGALPAAVAGVLAYLAISKALSANPNRARLLATLSGLGAGLAYLSRGDGVLVVLIIVSTLLVLIALKKRIVPSYQLETRQGLILVGLVVVGFLFVMTPWFIRNYQTFDTPTPPGSRAIFVDDYEDIFSVDVNISVSNYLNQPVSDLLLRRILRTARGTKQILSAFGLIIPLIVIAVLSRWLRWPIIFVLGVLHIIIGQAFYIIIAPELCCRPDRALLAALPIVGAGVALGVMGLSQKYRLAVASVLVLAFLVLGAETAKVKLQGLNDLERTYSWVGNVVHQDARDNGEASPIVMSRKPWRVFEISNVDALQIPYADKETILQYADRFGVTHIHLTDNTQRPSLQALYRGTETDEMFILIADRGNHKVFRLAK